MVFTTHDGVSMALPAPPVDRSGRQSRIKVIRRSLLRLLLKVAEHYVADANRQAGKTHTEKESGIGLLLRAFPPKYLIHVISHFGDSQFWQHIPSASTSMNRAESQGRMLKTVRRHNDPISALLTFQLLVALIDYPSCVRTFEKISGFRQLQVSLPNMFKALCVQEESNMPLLCQGKHILHVTGPIVYY